MNMSAYGESTESSDDCSERPDITLGRRRFADFVVRVYLDVCKARFTNNIREFTNAPPLESKQLKLGRHQNPVVPLLVAQPARRLVIGRVGLEMVSS